MYLLKKLWYVGVFLALAGVLAACAPASERPGPPVKAPAEEGKLKPQYGGTFIMRAGGGEQAAFDPRFSGVGGGQYNHVLGNVYNGLLSYPFNQVFTAAPLVCDLCERWEQTNDTTYVFYLRKGVKWQNKPPLNGRELTAEDVRWALADGESFDSKNARFTRRELTLKFGAKVEAVDKYTVKITIKEPTASFLVFLAGNSFTYSPKEAVEASKTDKNPHGFIGLGLTGLQYVIGSGPFMFKEFTPGIGATLVRNPDYFRKDEDGNQLPYLDEMKALFIPDHKLRTNAMLGGRLHESGCYLDNSDVAKLQKAGNFVIDVGYAGYGPFLEFNGEKPPFNDVRVRRALHLIVDRFEVMVPANLGGAEVRRWNPSAWQPFATPLEQVLKLPGYRPDKTQDFEEAKRLLKEAGLEGGFSFALGGVGGGKDMEHALVIQANLKPFKIDAKIEPYDRATYAQRRNDGAYQAMVYPIVGDTIDPASIFWRFHSMYSKMYHYWSDPKVDALIEKQEGTLDPKERAKIMAQLFDLLDENMPALSIYSAPWYWAWDKRFHMKAVPPCSGITRWVERIWMEK